MNEAKTLQDVLAYEPVPSRFGTSGVRALVKDLTDLEVYCLTLGTLRYLESSDRLVCSGPGGEPISIPLAGDLRPSTERMLHATARAIRDSGHEVTYCGRIPTPALSLQGLATDTASYVITGSHIPADRNGQKANRCDGEVLKSDEAGIVAAVQRVREQEYGRPVDESPFTPFGMFKTELQPTLPAATGAARERYIERYREVFPQDALSGMRVLFFQYAAVGRDLIPEILENAGAEVVRTGRSNTFVPIDTEAISDEHLRMLGDLVREHRGRDPIHAVISTDGDSDRPLVVAVEDCDDGEIGLRFIPGDLLGLLVADYLGVDSVSVPISTNPAVHEFFATRGLTTRKTKIGSPYVIQSMKDARQEGFERVVAWEANGGFLLGSPLKLVDGVLAALPTRDAAIAILCVLHAAARDGVGVGDLGARLPQWFGKSDLLDDFPRETSQDIVAHFAPPVAGAVWVAFSKEGVAARDDSERDLGTWGYGDAVGEEWLARKRLIEDVFSVAHGFGELSRVNVLDGVRCYFDNDDIAHIRPSGNAPQLRIYAHARTQARADAIAAAGVAEPDGLLRTLQRVIEGLA